MLGRSFRIPRWPSNSFARVVQGTLQGSEIEGFKDFSRHFSKWCDIFSKVTTIFKMARHFSENLVTAFLKTTVKYGIFEKSCRDIFGLSSMYRRYHVHFQLIFEPFYFEPLKCSITMYVCNLSFSAARDLGVDIGCLCQPAVALVSGLLVNILQLCLQT